MAGKTLQALNTEDWWAVWFGVVILGIAVLGFAGKAPRVGEWITNPLSAFQSYTRSVPLENKPADLDLSATAAQNLTYDAEKKLLIYRSLMTSERREVLKGLSADRVYQAAIDGLHASRPLSQGNNLLAILVLLVALGLLTAAGVKAMGGEAQAYLSGFAVIFVLAIISGVFAGQYTIDAYGLGYAFWALALGLLISNTVGTPRWLLAGAKTDMFIKTGLVLLGAEILFNKISTFGGPGLFVAWLAAPIAIVFMYLFGTRFLKISRKRLVLVVAATTALCGVPSAVATAAACQAKKKDLALAVGITLIGAVLFGIFLPLGIKLTGLDAIVGAAWLGGAIGSSGAYSGPGAEQAAAAILTIKNVLIGLTALFLAVYSATKTEDDLAPPPSRAGAIWHHFPKFMVGFIGASLVSSLILAPVLGPAVVEEEILGAMTRTLREWLFCLAFVSIGLELDFRDLAGQVIGGKPIWLYIIGQSFNLVLTLLAAGLAFGGILSADP
jgi:uncharacterized membrane protein YadS